MSVRLEPHEGHLLFFSYGPRLQFLWHRLTGEVAPAPPEHGVMRGVVFRNGQGVLHGDGADSIWAHTVLKQHVIRIDGQLFVVQKSPETGERLQRPLDVDRPARKRRGELTLRMAAAGCPSKVAVVAHDAYVHGALLEWSLPLLWRLLGAEEYKQWAHERGKCWDAWRKQIAACELDSETLCRQVNASGDAHGPHNQYAFASCTTHALLLLLLRWASRHIQSGRIEAAAPGAEDFLKALLKLLPTSFSLTVASGACVWTAPYMLHGDGLQRVQVVNGAVHLNTLRDADPIAFADALPSLGGRSTCTLREFLGAAPCLQERLGRSRVGWLPHCIWQIGTLLEASLLSLSLPALSNRNWLDEDHPAIRWMDCDLLEHTRAAFIMAYDAATKQLLDAKPQVVSVAVDDSRVARLNWKLTALLDCSSGKGLWLLPQARA